MTNIFPIMYEVIKLSLSVVFYYLHLGHIFRGRKRSGPLPWKYVKIYIVYFILFTEKKSRYNPSLHIEYQLNYYLL